jgi:hypothetical protein
VLRGGLLQARRLGLRHRSLGRHIDGPGQGASRAARPISRGRSIPKSSQLQTRRLPKWNTPPSPPGKTRPSPRLGSPGTKVADRAPGGHPPAVGPGGGQERIHECLGGQELAVPAAPTAQPPRYQPRGSCRPTARPLGPRAGRPGVPSRLPWTGRSSGLCRGTCSSPRRPCPVSSSPASGTARKCPA